MSVRGCRTTRGPMITVLCAMAIFASGAAAKHIVITYDVSGSMYRVGGQTKMTEDDIRRLNQHVLGLLFGPIPTESPHVVDQVTFVADGMTPLYSEGDEVTYVEVATSVRAAWTRRGEVTARDLRGILPDPNRVPAEFSGLNTNLKRARAQVYDRHYREGEETYWILVSDEDEDSSQDAGQEAGSLATVLRFEESHHLQSVFGMLVNEHVNVVARLVATGSPRGQGGALFVASAAQPSVPVKSIEFTRRDNGDVFESQPLVVVSSDAASHAYTCDTVMAQFVDGRGAPRGDPLPDVALGGDRPPRRFVLSLAVERYGPTASLRDIRLRVSYSHDGNVVMSPGVVVGATWRIDDVFVALSKRPTEPIDSLSLSAGPDGATWVSPKLVVNSSNPEIAAFALHQLFIRVLSKDEAVLDTREVEARPPGLGVPWQIVLPASKEGIDFEGNTIEVAVNYAFAGDAQKSSVAIAYSVKRDAPSALRWLLGLMAACVLVPLVIFGVKRLPFGRSPAVTIVLTQMDASRIGETQSRSFVLRKSARVDLRPGATSQNMDIGCPGYILHRGGGVFVLSRDGVSVPSRVRDGEEVQLQAADGETVWLRIDIVDVKAPRARSRGVDPLGSDAQLPTSAPSVRDASDAGPSSPLDL